MNVLLLFFTILLMPFSAMATQWSAVPNKTSIQFTASYDDAKFTGHFKNFSSSILIDPTNLQNSYIRSTVDITSVNTNSRDRDEALAKPDWFYFSKFPKALFHSTQISHIGDDNYEITGILKIRDQEKLIRFPLQWRVIDKTQAQVQAQFELDRRDFNIGTGDWLDDDTIGFKVMVDLTINYQPE